MKRTSKFLIIPVILLGLISGCKTESTSSNEDELLPGKFEGLVGTVPNVGLYEELGGNAYFFVNQEDTLLELALESTIVSPLNMTYVYGLMKRENMLTPGTYPFNNIEQVFEFFEDGFSGYYVSPEVGGGRSYYSESGTITIESVSDENIVGTLEGTFFFRAPTGQDEFTRVYTPIEAEFNAIFVNESVFFDDEEE